METPSAEIRSIVKELSRSAFSDSDEVSIVHDTLIGKLYLNVGPMSSGKTSDLIQKCTELEQQGIATIVLRSSLDTRSGASRVASQNGSHHACIAVDNLLANKDLFEAIVSYVQVVFLDEAQFFDRELIEFCRRMTDDHGKCVYVYALNGDSERNAFGHVHDLYSLADDIRMFKGFCATCQRGKPGVFTSCNVDKKGKQLLVGHQGIEYVTQCRECYVHTRSEQKNS